MTVYKGEVVQVEELNKIARKHGLSWAVFKGSQPYDKGCLLMATDQWYIIHRESSNHEMRDWLNRNGAQLRELGWLGFFQLNKIGGSKLRINIRPSPYRGMII